MSVKAQAGPGAQASTSGIVIGRYESGSGELQEITYAELLAALGGQTLDAELTALASVTSAANKVPMFTGSGTATVISVTAAAITVLDDTTVGNMLTTLGGQTGHASLTSLSTAAIAVTGSKVAGAAFDSLLAALVTKGLITDGTSA